MTHSADNGEYLTCPMLGCGQSAIDRVALKKHLRDMHVKHKLMFINPNSNLHPRSHTHTHTNKPPVIRPLSLISIPPAIVYSSSKKEEG